MRFFGMQLFSSACVEVFLLRIMASGLTIGTRTKTRSISFIALAFQKIVSACAVGTGYEL
jgi:hypothetical protein